MLKFGRKPAVHTLRTMRLAIVMNRHLAALGTPPANSDDYTAAVEAAVGGASNWGLLGNDKYGDCVEADDGHTLMLRTANAGTIVIPTTQNILDLYSAETGFNPADPNTDQGTDETSDCAYMVSTGLLGHKASATAPIDPANWTHLQWGVQIFGSVKLGIVVTQGMMDQFNAGQPWDGTGDQTQLGGHDVPLIRYYSDGSSDVITWGKRQHVEAPFFAPSANIVEEAHGLPFADFIKATGVTVAGFDLAQMLADLQAVEQTS